MSNLLLRLIFRLLDPQLIPKVEEQAVEKWLADQYQNNTFRRMCLERDAIIVRKMASGLGFSPEPRDRYTMLFGRRLENLALLRRAEKAYGKMIAKQRATPPTKAI